MHDFTNYVLESPEKLGVSQEAVLEELKNTKLEGVPQSAEITPFKVESRNMSAEGRKKLLEDKIILRTVGKLFLNFSLGGIKYLNIATIFIIYFILRHAIRCLL